MTALMSQTEGIYSKRFELTQPLGWISPSYSGDNLCGVMKNPTAAQKKARTCGQAFWSPDSLLWCCCLCSAPSIPIPITSSNRYGSNGTHVLDPSVRTQVLPLRLSGLGYLSSLVCLLGLFSAFPTAEMLLELKTLKTHWWCCCSF